MSIIRYPFFHLKKRAVIIREAKRQAPKRPGRLLKEREKCMEKKASLVGRLLSENQMSEAFINSMFLALSGGFQDAYTYNCRDEVFSNAQTGNVVLMSQNFLEGNFTAGLRYLFPTPLFVDGWYFWQKIYQEHYRYAKRLHWRQVLLAAEIVILAIVGFIPSSYNMLAAMLVSFACAIQVQTFRKVGGYSYASTMCIGNLRSGTAALSMYLRDKKKTAPSGRILFRRDSGFRHRRRNRRRVLHAVWNPRNLDFLRTSSGELPSDVTGKVPLRNKRE